MTRDEFMEFVYNELANDPDNIRANRIIDAADEYAETYSNGGYPDQLFVDEGYKKIVGSNIQTNGKI